jgi:hypothetical protein
MICDAWSALSGIRQASAPAPGAHLELGPLGRCPRPLPRAPTLEDSTILGVIMAFWGRMTIQTEVDKRGPLFPKEQVPASTPIPPRSRDHGFLILTTKIRWIALVVAAALAGCAHDPPAATIPATTIAPEPAPAAALVPAPGAAPASAQHSPVKIAPTIATTTPRPDGSQELRDYCKTASRVSCQRASEKREGCFQLKSVAFGIHLQVIASSRSMSLSEARDLAARNAHELPPDLAVAIASQVTPGILADGFANDIYRRCLTS